MPATNYTPIQLYRTNTASTTAPSGANLNAGELAINYNDSGMILYAKNTSGTVIKLMNNPANLLYPTADGFANQVIKTNGSGVLSFATVVTSPGGTDTQVQFNDSGSFGGDSGLTYNKTTDVLTVAGSLSVNGITVGRGAGSVSGNTAVGASALQANTTGSANTAVGASALSANTTASNNTAVGYFALYNSNRTTDIDAYNTAIGYSSGSAITTGAKNTILGAYNGNQGGLDIRTASNYIVLSDGDGNPRLIGNGSGNFGVGQNPSSAKFSVNGEIKYDPRSTLGYGLNLNALVTFNNNNLNTVANSIANSGFVVVTITQGNGATTIPIFANAGGGVAFAYSVFDPDAGTFTYGSGSPSVSFATAGTGANSYTLTLQSGNANIDIQRTSGSAAYTVAVSVFLS